MIGWRVKKITIQSITSICRITKKVKEERKIINIIKDKDVSLSVFLYCFLFSFFHSIIFVFVHHENDFVYFSFIYNKYIFSQNGLAVICVRRAPSLFPIFIYRSFVCVKSEETKARQQLDDYKSLEHNSYFVFTSRNFNFWKQR